MYFVAFVVIHYSWCDFLQANKAHVTSPQTTVFVWIFLRIYNDDEERMDDEFKPMMIIADLLYVSELWV